MTYWNRHEIERELARRKSGTVLVKGALILAALAADTDLHSYGWHIWRQPVRAAEPLMRLLTRSNAQGATEAELRAALKPIRSFMTRLGDRAGMDRKRIFAPVDGEQASQPKPGIRGPKFGRL